MSSAIIESVTVTEKLRINIEGKVYTLERTFQDDLFKKMKISIEELSQLKKLPSNLRDHLFTKYILKADIKEVVGNDQTSLLF